MPNNFETKIDSYPEGFLERKQAKLNKLGTTIAEIQEKIISEFGSLENFKAVSEERADAGGNRAGVSINKLSEQEEEFKEEKRNSFFKGGSVVLMFGIVEALDLYTIGGTSISEQIANIKTAFEAGVMSEMTAASMLAVLLVGAVAYCGAEIYDAFEAKRASKEIAKEKEIKKIGFEISGVQIDRGGSNPRS